jgi:exosortase/archaeosortase family protein
MVRNGMLRDLRRDHFFCGLLILTVVNGLQGPVYANVTALGWSEALLGLFGVSAVVWIACFAAASLLYTCSADEAVTIPDTVIGLGVLSMTILPFSRLGWLALALLSLYMLSAAPAQSPRRRAALIALAVTGPVLWGPALLEVFTKQILQTDAILVSSLIGTDRTGNVFSGAIGSDGSPTHFVIYPGCSSLHGMSIAVLAWITISNTLGSGWSTKHLAWGVLAAVSVVVVNVSRMSLIGLFPDYYSTIHGSPGSEIAAWLSLTLVVVISLLGAGREALRS